MGRITRILDEKKLKDSIKEFQKLLKKGDKIRTEFIWDKKGKTVDYEVAGFDGLEFKMKGHDEKHNLGMGQGFTVQPNGFIIYANGEPMIRVTKR